ncbi:MAG TPA: hypothetical protein VE397_19515 [Stellaceae bacterium]|jgi:hypothetical protein|nr:hypothetical protein [Stellaceae bacterium]
MRALLAAGAITILCLGGAAAEPAGARDEAALRTGIAQGTDAAAKCESQSWSVEDYSACIDGTIGHAMDNDNATMPFQLGVYCTAFFKLAQAYSSGAWKQSMIDQTDARVATVDQYGSCVFSARSIGLASDRICTPLGVDCRGFKAALHRWEHVSHDM